MHTFTFFFLSNQPMLKMNVPSATVQFNVNLFLTCFYKSVSRTPTLTDAVTVVQVGETVQTLTEGRCLKKKNMTVVQKNTDAASSHLSVSCTAQTCFRKLVQKTFPFLSFFLINTVCFSLLRCQMGEVCSKEQQDNECTDCQEVFFFCLFV